MKYDLIQRLYFNLSINGQSKQNHLQLQIYFKSFDREANFMPTTFLMVQRSKEIMELEKRQAINFNLTIPFDSKSTSRPWCALLIYILAPTKCYIFLFYLWCAEWSNRQYLFRFLKNRKQSLLRRLGWFMAIGFLFLVTNYMCISACTDRRSAISIFVRANSLSCFIEPTIDFVNEQLHDRLSIASEY